MKGTRNALWAVMLSVGVLSLALNLWQMHRQAQTRQSLWATACQPCVAQAIQDTAFLEARLAARRMSPAERKAYGQALDRLDACAQELGTVQGQTAVDEFYEPLDRLQFWQAQAVQLARDSARLDRRRDQGMLQLAVRAIHSMRLNQVRCAVMLGQAAVGKLGLQGGALASAQAWAALEPGPRP